MILYMYKKFDTCSMLNLICQKFIFNYINNCKNFIKHHRNLVTKSNINVHSFNKRSVVYLGCLSIFADRKLQSSEFPHNIYIQNYSTATSTCITLRRWLFSPGLEAVLNADEQAINFLFWEVRGGQCSWSWWISCKLAFFNIVRHCVAHCV